MQNFVASRCPFCALGRFVPIKGAESAVEVLVNDGVANARGGGIRVSKELRFNIPGKEIK